MSFLHRGRATVPKQRGRDPAWGLGSVWTSPSGDMGGPGTWKGGATRLQPRPCPGSEPGITESLQRRTQPLWPPRALPWSRAGVWGSAPGGQAGHSSCPGLPGFGATLVPTKLPFRGAVTVMSLPASLGTWSPCREPQLFCSGRPSVAHGAGSLRDREKGPPGTAP